MLYLIGGIMTIIKYSYQTKAGPVIRYGYDFIHQGVRYQRRGFKTKRETEREERNLKRVLESPQPKGMAFCELCGLYLDRSEAYNTLEWYADKKSRIIKKYQPWFGKFTLISEITTKQIEDFIIMIAKTVSNITANRDLVVLSSIFNFAVDNDYLLKNPCRKISRLPVEKKIRHIPTPEDIAKVLLVLKKDRRDMLQIVKGTMARSIEVAQRLTWNDINFKKKTITLYTRKSKGGDLRPQVKPMTDTVFEILKERFKNRIPENDFVFFNPKTNRPYNDRHWLQKACMRAGVKPFGLHALRHLGVSLLDSAGINPKKIQGFLGHTDSRTSQIYTHDIKENGKALEALENKLTTKSTIEHLRKKEEGSQ